MIHGDRLLLSKLGLLGVRSPAFDWISYFVKGRIVAGQIPFVGEDNCIGAELLNCL